MECHTGRFERSSRLLRMRSQVAKGGNPADHDQSRALLQRYGFEIVTDGLYREPVTFRSFDDVEAWAFHSGWAAEVFDSRYSLRVAAARVVFGLAEVFYRPLYPVDATNEISIVLARKPG